MAVYAVRWNEFHPRVFLSCSADWTVRRCRCASADAPEHVLLLVAVWLTSRIVC